MQYHCVDKKEIEYPDKVVQFVVSLIKFDYIDSFLTFGEKG